MRSGRRPRVRFPSINPRPKPTVSSTANLADARLRSVRAWRVSLPWMVLASAQRFRPSGVLGPVDAPPWNLHFVLPLEAGAQHCSLVGLDLA